MKHMYFVLFALLISGLVVGGCTYKNKNTLSDQAVNIQELSEKDIPNLSGIQIWSSCQRTYMLAESANLRGDTATASHFYLLTVRLLGEFDLASTDVDVETAKDFYNEVLNHYDQYLSSHRDKVASPAIQLQEEKQTGVYKYLNVDVANVRSGPSSTHEVVGQLRFPKVVTCIDSTIGEWQAFQFDSVTRWIHKSLLSDDSYSAAAANTAARQQKDKNNSYKQSSTAVRSSGYISIGTPADDVVETKGKCNYTEVLGEDDNGYIVAWHYSDVTYIMKRWTEYGIECYRVAEKRY